MSFPAKPFASLSSGLLARKGHAKPAMRPQLLGSGQSLDDLGWNDMGGHDAPASQPVTLPPVLAQREELAARIEAPDGSGSGSDAPVAVEEPTAASSPAPAPLPVPAASPVKAISAVEAARIGRESALQTARGKAAFTLRLDAVRHLRLRLASAVSNRSAQAVVTDALDRFLLTMPEVEALAAQLPDAKGTR